MIQAWLDLSVWMLFAVLAAFYVSTAILLNWLTFARPLRPLVLSFGGIVAPFFSSVAILFVLLVGFQAKDVADRNKEAHRAVYAERDSLMTLATLAHTSGMNPAGFNDSLRAYAGAVADDEWNKMTDQKSSERAQEALETLLRTVSAPNLAGVSPLMQTTMLNTVMRLRTARADRLALSSDRSNELQRLTVLLLGVMTQLAIVVVHLERRRAQAGALVVFTASIVIALGLIAVQESPFDGPVRLSPEPIRAVLAAIKPAA